MLFFFFFSSRRRHTRYWRDWSSDVCSSDLDHARQRHPYRRAFARLAVDGDCAVVGLDDGPRDRETEANTARPPAAGLLAPVEPVEDPRQLIRAHPTAGIADGKSGQFLVSGFQFLVVRSTISHPASCSLPTRNWKRETGNPDRSARRRVGDRV